MKYKYALVDMMGRDRTKTMKYALINMMDRAGDNAVLGRVVSRHGAYRTAMAANRRFQPRERGAYLPTTIIEIGAPVNVGDIIRFLRNDNGWPTDTLEDGHELVGLDVPDYMLP